MSIVGILWQTFTKEEQSLWKTEVARIKGKPDDFVSKWRQTVFDLIKELVRLKRAIHQNDNCKTVFDEMEINKLKNDYFSLFDKGCPAGLEFRDSKKEIIDNADTESDADV